MGVLDICLYIYIYIYVLQEVYKNTHLQSVYNVTGR